MVDLGGMFAAGGKTASAAAISFATIQNGMLATAAHATGVPDTTNRIMTLGATTSTALFAAVAALNGLITLTVGRERDLATMAVTG